MLFRAEVVNRFAIVVGESNFMNEITPPNPADLANRVKPPTPGDLTRRPQPEYSATPVSSRPKRPVSRRDRRSRQAPDSKAAEADQTRDSTPVNVTKDSKPSGQNEVPMPDADHPAIDKVRKAIAAGKDFDDVMRRIPDSPNLLKTSGSMVRESKELREFLNKVFAVDEKATKELSNKEQVPLSSHLDKLKHFRASLEKNLSTADIGLAAVKRGERPYSLNAIRDALPPLSLYVRSSRQAIQMAERALAKDNKKQPGPNNFEGNQSVFWS